MSIEKKNLKPRNKWVRRLKIFILIYCSVGIGLYYTQEYILLHPKKLDSKYAFSFNQPFEELNIPFNKTDTINLVKFLPVDSVRKGIVIYFHGNKDNIEHYSAFAPSFTKHGYEVWMPDYPGYGKSTGTFTEKKLYTIAYQLQKMASQKYHDDSIIIYGKSLGTAVATYTAGIRRFKMLILETPYYSIPALFKSYAFMYPASMMSKYEFPTYEFLQEIKSPVTIFHGTGDWVVPFRSGKRLKQFLKPGDVFIKIPGGSHNDLAKSETYRRVLDSLLSIK